jgi:hypothetical protein
MNHLSQKHLKFEIYLKYLLRLQMYLKYHLSQKLLR